MKAPATYAIAVLIALTLSASHLLDGPEDHSGDWSASDAITEQQAEAAARASRDFAAQAVCGPNAGYAWLSDKELQCFTKHGRKAGKQVQL